MCRNTGVKWIPESPNHSGLYANEIDLNPGKISIGKAVSTLNVYSSRQFDSELECTKWCNDNPTPKFIPVEHEFG